MNALEHMKRIIPPLTGKLYKGQSGKIGVLGGSKEYSGAPYYAAYSALKVGADLSHIFCTEQAGVAIKSFSPELIVHPLLKTTENLTKQANKEDEDVEKESLAKQVLNHVAPWLESIQVLVIGPGLGRDEFVLFCTKKIIEKARQEKVPMVIDGDGLFLVSQDPGIISGYPLAILTPNVNEFNRLCDSNKINEEPKLENLCKSMGGITIVRKGAIDVVSNGTNVLECKEKGSPRRCGGQGDILAGAIGVFFAWATQAEKRNPEETKKIDLPLPVLAGYGGCFLNRKCGEAAFAKHFRATTTPNIIEEIGPVFESIWPSKL